MISEPNKIGAANAGWRQRFRFAAHALWPRVADLSRRATRMVARRRRYLLFAGLLFLVIIVAFAVTKPSSPDGRYVASNRIGAAGDFYHEFSGGKVYFVSHQNADVEGGWKAATSRRVEGEYFRSKGGWSCFGETRRSNAAPVKVECSWLGVWLSAPDGSREFWRRRFMPGYRPEWMLRSLPWCIQ